MKRILNLLTAVALVAAAAEVRAGTARQTGPVVALESMDGTATCQASVAEGDFCADDDVHADDDLVCGDDLTVGDDAVVTDDLSAADITASGTLSSPIVASSLQAIRFCGNGPDGATTTYIGPVLASDIIDATGGAQDPVDITFGSAFCDGLDNTTEATAERVWHAGWAFRPVAMSCVGLCTGASAANDQIVFQMRDDAASATGVTCTTAALGGDGVPAQCTVRIPTASQVAAASAIAVSVTMTNDDCNDAGDDFECVVFGSFQ